MPDPILYGKGRCCRIHIDTQEYQKKVSDSVSKKIGIGKKFRIRFRSDFGFRHTLGEKPFQHIRTVIGMVTM